MNCLAKRKLPLLALVLALSFPTVVYSGGFFSWWSSPPAPPVEDVDFDSVSTFAAAFTCYFVVNRQLDSTSAVQFSPVEISAQVASEVITFEQLVLFEDPYTITIDIDPATLKTDRFGSRFCAPAAITVDDGTDTTNINGKIFGRISERNDMYYLSGVVLGTYIEYQGQGSGVIKVVRVPLSGTTPVPVTP